jgi:AhpD family alkylhydroperoxidase
MATTPRIPKELVEGFFMQVEDDGSPAAAIAIPVELSRLAGIPIATKRSFQLDPVLHELIRIYNAKYQDCQYCQNARQAVAVQAGLKEDMVSQLADFENSPHIPENFKSALRITSAVATAPALLTDELWNGALQHFSERELIDIVLLSMHTTASKVTITLGLDPGKDASSRLFFPDEDVYGESEDLADALADLRSKGVVVSAPGGAVLAPGADLRSGAPLEAGSR